MFRKPETDFHAFGARKSVCQFLFTNYASLVYSRISDAVEKSESNLCYSRLLVG